MDEMKGILKVINLAEKLKFELRHSFLSNGRQESVAEHTWRVSLMAMLLEKYLSKPIDTEKLLKMIIIHDLVEAEAGDIPAFNSMNNEEVKKLKHENEVRAIERIRDMLGVALGPELYDLWMEFEDKETYEAKVANGLDKLEAQVQHNEAELATWIDIEYDMCYMMDKHVEFEPALMELKSLILDQAEKKMKNGGIDIEAIKEKGGK
jgi:putative hydrolase of HD superfamily